MGLLRAFLLGIGVAFFVHNFHTVPVPQNVSEPFKVRIALGVSRLTLRVAWLLDYIGIVPEVTSRRFFIESSTAISNSQSPDVKRLDMSFGGVPVRVYTPAEYKDGPGIIFFHGGGWILGSIDSYDFMCEFMSRITNAVVVSVEYRLNPENSHSDGLKDCVTATKFFFNNANKFGVDNQRIALAGDSAGGNYAAVVALYLRDNEFSPKPKLQVLIYPSVQAIDLSLPSFQQNAEGPFVDKANFCWAKSYLFFKSNKYLSYFEGNTHVTGYVRKKMAASKINHKHLPDSNKYPPYEPPKFSKNDKSEIWSVIEKYFLDPYHYPLMADDHSNVPEAYIFTAQYDQLRDDGYLYAHILREDGVKVTHYNCENCWHGMFNFMRILDEPKNVMMQIMIFVKDTL